MEDDQDRYWTSKNGSQANSKQGASKTVTSPAVPDPDRLLWLQGRARMVFASYRKDDFADPEIFNAALVTVLERYSDKIVEGVTNYITGIQSTCKFPPSIAEMTEFCNELKRRADFPTHYDERSRKQLEERAELERNDKTEPADHRKAVVDRAMAEMRAKGFAFEGDEKPSLTKFNRYSDDQLRAMYGKGDQ